MKRLRIGKQWVNPVQPTDEDAAQSVDPEEQQRAEALAAWAKVEAKKQEQERLEKRICKCGHSEFRHRSPKQVKDGHASCSICDSTQCPAFLLNKVK